MNEIINIRIRKLNLNDKTTMLWILSLVRGMKGNISQSIIQKNSPRHCSGYNHVNCQKLDSSYPYKKGKHTYPIHLKSTLALSVEHELQSRDKFANSNLKKGWIIDSSSSTHMTPFKNDYKSISTTRRTIYLADNLSIQ